MYNVPAHFPARGGVVSSPLGFPLLVSDGPVGPVPPVYALPHLSCGWFGLRLCLPCAACPGGHVLVCRGVGPPSPEVLWILLTSRAATILDVALSRNTPSKFCLPRQNLGSSSLTGKFEEPYNFVTEAKTLAEVNYVRA